MNLAEQLTAIYHKEDWHKTRLTDEQANEYHERLLMQGNIITYVENDELLGYLEFWRINFEQFGRLLCDIPILTDVEDITTGNIAYINNMWITPDKRNSHVFAILGESFLYKNQDAQFFATFRPTKYVHPVKVYSREDLIRFYKK